MTESDKTTVATEAAPQKQYDFFVVHPAKLAIMSVATFGLYLLYWGMMNWSVVRKADNSGIYPFWRSFFSIFFNYSLFQKMGNKNALALAIAYFVVCLICAVPSLYWFWLLAIAPPVIVQDAYNKKHNLKPGFTFTAKAVVVTVIGLLIVFAVAKSGNVTKPYSEQIKENQNQSVNQ